MKSLLYKYNDMIIESKLVYENDRVISERNTSIILEESFLEMYKNKMKFKIPLRFESDRIADAEHLRLNLSYLVSINGNYEKIFASSEEITKYHSHKKGRGFRTSFWLIHNTTRQKQNFTFRQSFKSTCSKWTLSFNSTMNLKFLAHIMTTTFLSR